MVLYILLAILLIGLLVMGHEFGHFCAARLTGIAVKEFSVGFGPKLLARTSKKSGTQFSLRAFPLGGYCMFYGESTDDPEGKNNKHDDERDFTKQAVWKRMATVFSGPLMNFVLALIAAVLMLMIYYVPVKPYVASVSEGTPAYEAGLKRGDEFVLVGGENVDGAMSKDVSSAIQRAAGGGSAISLTLRRGGELLDFSVMPVYDEGEGRYLMGIGIQGPLPASQVLPEAFRLLGQGAVAIIGALKGLVTTGEGLDQTTGIIGVVQQVAVATQQGGFQVFLYLMVIISINLGLINLIPIPGLDGSRIVFLTLEAIRRKPINQKIEATVHLIGYAALFTLMIVLVFKDVGRIFGA